MESVLRAAALYAILLVLFRVTGRRSLRETTPFDLVLLLVIGEATQQALLGEDFSLINAALVIATLILLDVLLSWGVQRSRTLSRLVQGVPMVVVADGRPLRDRMRRARVEETDVMAAARQSQGLERMEQIKYAIVETSGAISVIPKDR